VSRLCCDLEERMSHEGSNQYIVDTYLWWKRYYCRDDSYVARNPEDEFILTANSILNDAGCQDV
jgi:hypothetical protein